MKISVIVPVYNAAGFVTQAVESALSQPETGEVILIEDGSPDGSLQECKQLAKMYEKLRLLQHPGGVNKGAGASRNLGMQNAKFDYIAFLDADDFFLQGRFKETAKVFKNNPDCDGVYEAIGTIVEDEEAKARLLNSVDWKGELLTVTQEVPPEGLLEMLVLGGAGFFSINGLVIKKSVLIVSGYMDSDLKLHQDTEFFFRLAAVARLYPGNLTEPVAKRRIHHHNRMSAPDTKKNIYASRFKMWISSFRWFRSNRLFSDSKLILKGLLSLFKNYDYYTHHQKCRYLIEIRKRLRLILLFFIVPEVVFYKEYWNTFLPARISLFQTK